MLSTLHALTLPRHMHASGLLSYPILMHACYAVGCPADPMRGSPALPIMFPVVFVDACMLRRWSIDNLGAKPDHPQAASVLARPCTSIRIIAQRLRRCRPLPSQCAAACATRAQLKVFLGNLFPIPTPLPSVPGSLSSTRNTPQLSDIERHAVKVVV